jgi:hypothetical protein
MGQDEQSMHQGQVAFDPYQGRDKKETHLIHLILGNRHLINPSKLNSVPF